MLHEKTCFVKNEQISKRNKLQANKKQFFHYKKEKKVNNFRKKR